MMAKKPVEAAASVTICGEGGDTDGMNMDLPFQFLRNPSHMARSAIAAVPNLRICSGYCAWERNTKRREIKDRP